MAVFGIFGNQTQDVASSIYYGLYALQHRGQSSCGIVVGDDGVFNFYKDSGLVNEVFTHRRLHLLLNGLHTISPMHNGHKTRVILCPSPIIYPFLLTKI